MIRLAFLVVLSGCALLLAPFGSRPAQAMCGGNFFLTCPPPAASASKKRERRVHEPRRRHKALKDQASAR